MEQLNPIACELCRTKKCKCDRKIPTCSQCRSARTTCQYPQGNKRGIPSGYISSLEQRLLDTETALFEALSFISVPSHLSDSPPVEAPYRVAFTEHSTALSKEAKMREWKRFPLKFGDQRQAWLREKCRTAKGTEGGRNFAVESPASQGTEHQWRGSPLLQPVGQNATQAVSQRQFPIHRHSAQIAEGIITDEYQTNMNGEGSLQTGHDPSQTQLETSRRLLNDDHWKNHSAPWQLSEGNRGSIGEGNGTYGLDVLVDNSHFLHGQDSMVARVSPPPSRDQQSSISSGHTRPPREARQFSSKQWQKYF